MLPLWVGSGKKWLLTVEHGRCLDYLSLDLFGWGGFIPFKDPPLALPSGRAPGPSCDSRSQPAVRAHRAPDQTGSSLQEQETKPSLSFLHQHLRNQFSALLFFFFLRLSSVLESPVLVAKKMELTKENINALLSSGSFKQKTLSTFSRGSNQTSGGRGPGRREQRWDPSDLCPSSSLTASKRCYIIRRLFPERLPIIVLKPAEGEIIKRNQSWPHQSGRGFTVTGGGGLCTHFS